MEDGWGNFIYLILAAIVAIYSSIKKKKKPIPMSPPDDGELAEQATPQPPKQESDFESVFEALLGQQTPEPYLEETEWEEEEIIAEKEEVLDSVPEQTNPLESSIEYSEERKNSSFEALKEIYKNEDEDEEEIEREEIDWRQAIIYKEILDRKYN